MPETGGIALGIERLQMLLLDIQDINELLVLPAKELWSKTLNHSF
jgi:lysyl-tRNA synthetase class II